MSVLDQYFRYKCEKGLKERGLAHIAEYQERLKYEMDTIIKMGFPGYFLIVQDFITWAKNNDIMVGPGRGSAAGSLVSYSMDITNLDPIKWDLLFERFLNPSRISMPDIDIDIEKRYRDRVIKYVEDKYGKDHVAHIGTFGKQRAKAAVRSVCRTLGHPYIIGDQLSKLLLAPIAGKPQKLALSIEKVEEIHDYVEANGTQAEILRWAQKIEDTVCNAGVHASGIVISNEPLVKSVPLFRGRSGELTTQWEMNNIERVGLIKFDFLGLDALNKIHRCADLINERYTDRFHEPFDIDDIDLEDDDVFANLRSGDAVGAFQLEGSSGIRDLMVQIRPTHIEDLIALVAIYRPGPLGAAYKERYLAIRAGEETPVYLVPELEPILKRTDGWLIYQEQCMEIAKKLCGYSGSDADDLRKAIGKKKKKMMDKHESMFKEGWVKHGLPVDRGDILWDQMVKFAEYGFNRSHAAAYAMITYQTAWLKTHYPTEFMCAVMISEGGDKDDMIKSIAECKRIKIKVLAPDINTSKESFCVEDKKTIRFGLGPIKNLGENVSYILEEREFGEFQSLRDFCERVDLGKVNRMRLESLIRAGAFDRFGDTRASMLEAIELIWDHRKKTKSYEKKLETYDKKVLACEQRLIDITNGVKSTTNKPLKALKDPVRPERPLFPEMPHLMELSDQEIQKAEHELLGLFISSHPLDYIARSRFFDVMNSVEDIKELPNSCGVSLGAVLTNKNEITTKTKKKMAFLRVEDLTGSIEAVLFSSVYKRFQDILEETDTFRFDGIVEVTEGDDSRVTKLVVRKVRPLNLEEPTKPTKFKATVPATRAKEATRILNKYPGDVHEVELVLTMHDGTTVLPGIFKIGDYKGAFERDIARLK